jgi:2-octaprenyl-6-methoxyphenol hydroxylase
MNADPLPQTLTADVLIVGGGLAGLPLAIACATAGVSVIVVDREVPSIMVDEPFDGRTTAVALGSQRMLETLGIWQDLADSAEPILDIRIVDRNGPMFLHYDHRDVGDAPMGWIVENRAFRQALFAAMARVPSLVHLAPNEVVSLDRTAHSAEAQLDDGRRIRVRIAVAADGKNSVLRSWADIGTWGHVYDQQSLTCTVEHERPHHGVAVEHFLPSGPFAILPLRGNRSSIVWTERTTLIPEFLALEPTALDRAVAERFGDWLGKIRVIGRPIVYPLQLQIARRMVAQRLALIGDAAHVIHPIAGQGWNLGMRDVGCLAELIVDACRLGLDPGAPALLARYDAQRRRDAALLAAATDGLNRLFRVKGQAAAAVRAIGLDFVNRAAPVRRLFMRHAMGLTGSAPRLADHKLR